jgi:hypothetical protein
VLSELAPAQFAGWLLGLHRAAPSAPLDECDYDLELSGELCSI